MNCDFGSSWLRQFFSSNRNHASKRSLHSSWSSTETLEVRSLLSATGGHDGDDHDDHGENHVDTDYPFVELEGPRTDEFMVQVDPLNAAALEEFASRGEAVAGFRGLFRISVAPGSDVDSQMRQSETENGVEFAMHSQPGLFEDGAQPSRMPVYVDGELKWPSDTGNPFDLADTFKLASRPSAKKTLYIDYDGHVGTAGSIWNSQSWYSPGFVFPAYDRNNDPSTFSNSELVEIQQAYLSVVNDFAPFDLNVTTIEPDIEDLRNTGGGDDRWGARMVHTQVVGGMPSAGGYAFLNSFSHSHDTEGFSFNKGVNNGSMTVSHEAGHMFGLRHDGLGSRTYHPGSGSGATSWGPIMGAPFGKRLVQWSDGNYADSTNTEDDYSIMTSSRNGFGFVPDEAGDTAGTSAPLTVVNADSSGQTVDQPGILARTGEADVFSFETSDVGNVTLRAETSGFFQNVDLKIELLASDFTTILAEDAPSGNVNAQIDVLVPSGTYYVRISPQGESPAPTEYGNVGHYRITGTVPPIFGGDPTLLLNLPTTSIAENDGRTFTGTIRRQNSDRSAALTVDIANSLPDELTVPAQVEIPAGQSEATFSYSVVDDPWADGDQTATISVSATSFVGASDDVTVRDNEVRTFSLAWVAGNTMPENGGSLQILVTHNLESTDADILAELSENDSDDAISIPADVTIPAGGRSASFTVSATDNDTLDPTGRRATLRAANASEGFAPGPEQEAVVTDHELIGVSLTRDHVAENAVPAQRPRLSILRVPATNGPAFPDVLPVTISVSDRTEILLPSQFNIAGGLSAGVLSVVPLDDSMPDGTQTVTVTISAPGYIASQVTIDVLDNEGTAVVAEETGGGTTVGEDLSTDEVSVRLNARPIGDVVINVLQSDLSEFSVDKQQLLFSPDDWDQPQLVTVTGKDDNLADGDVLSSLRFAVNNGSSDSLFHNRETSVEVTTVDDETYGLDVTESDGDTVVTEAGGQDTVLVRLSSRPVSPVVVDVRTSNERTLLASPNRLIFSAFNWDVARTVTVQGIDDDIANGTRPIDLVFDFNAELTDNLFGALDDVRVSVDVTDNEHPGLRVLTGLLPFSVSEDETAQTFEVVLTARPESPVVVTARSSDETEVMTQPQTLSFGPENWNTPQRVTVTGVDDLLFDGLQQAQIVVSVDVAQSAAAFGDVEPQSLPVIISDNEPGAPTIYAPGRLSYSARPVFHWTEVEGAVNYDLWISNATTGESPWIREDVEATSYQSAVDMPLGTYLAWVRADLESGLTTPWSQVRRVSVRTRPVIENLPYRLEDSTPTIRWSTVSGATRYEVWVEKRFSNPNPWARNNNVAGTEWTLPNPLPLGLYRVWVRAFDGENRPSAWSQAEHFVSAAPPVNNGPDLPTFNRTPEFDWDRVSGARGYQLYVRNQRTGEVVINKTIPGLTNYTPEVSLTDGTYRWWTRAYTDHNVRSLWSEPQDFSVGGRPELYGPEGEAGNARPVFTWSRVDGAFRYELFVTRGDGSGFQIYEPNLLSPAYRPGEDLAAGDYRFWVRAVSTNGEVSRWSQAMDFSVAELETQDSDTPRNALALAASVIVSDLEGMSDETREEAIGRSMTPSDGRSEAIPQATGEVVAEATALPLPTIDSSESRVADEQDSATEEIDRVLATWDHAALMLDLIREEG